MLCIAVIILRQYDRKDKQNVIIPLHYVGIKKQKVTMTGWKSPEFSFLELNGK
jgi:uncharacterized membrane protein YoaT (DUF817 family)